MFKPSPIKDTISSQLVVNKVARLWKKAFEYHNEKVFFEKWRRHHKDAAAAIEEFLRSWPKQDNVVNEHVKRLLQSRFFVLDKRLKEEANVKSSGKFNQLQKELYTLLRLQGFKMEEYTNEELLSPQDSAGVPVNERCANVSQGDESLSQKEEKGGEDASVEACASVEEAIFSEAKERKEERYVLPEQREPSPFRPPSVAPGMTESDLAGGFSLAQRPSILAKCVGQMARVSPVSTVDGFPSPFRVGSPASSVTSQSQSRRDSEGSARFRRIPSLDTLSKYEEERDVGENLPNGIASPDAASKRRVPNLRAVSPLSDVLVKREGSEPGTLQTP